MNSAVMMTKQYKGFTLIEVMVALTIIAIALASLIKASGSHSNSAGFLKNKTLAHYVAVNEATKLQIEKTWPNTGKIHKSSEMADREWYWTREVTKYNVDDTIRTVTFTVFEDENRERNIARIQTSLLSPKANQ